MFKSDGNVIHFSAPKGKPPNLILGLAKLAHVVLLYIHIRINPLQFLSPQQGKMPTLTNNVV